MANSGRTDQQKFLPDTCRAKNVLYITLISQLLAVILALNSSFISGDFWSVFSLNALFILWIAFSCAAIFCLLKRQMGHWSPIKTSVFVFSCINLVTLFVTWLATDLLPQLHLFSTATNGHINVYLKNTGISLIASVILLRFLYIQFEWKKQIQAEADARLDALQARIRPHFLFNSLNTIASLTRIDPPLAESLTENLAELFRANLQSPKRLVTFKQEIDLVQQYLKIEQSRLGERLLLNIQLADIPDDALIPPLSVQPLVENAIYHGIEPSASGGTLTISGHVKNKLVYLIIKNPLSDQLPANSRPSNQMAIDNIRLRMQNCFPDQSKLLVSVSDGEFQTLLQFPLQTEAP